MKSPPPQREPASVEIGNPDSVLEDVVIDRIRSKGTMPTLRLDFKRLTRGRITRIGPGGGMLATVSAIASIVGVAIGIWQIWFS